VRSPQVNEIPAQKRWVTGTYYTTNTKEKSYLDSVFIWLSGTVRPGLIDNSDEDWERGKAGGYSSSETRSRT